MNFVLLESLLFCPKKITVSDNEKTLPILQHCVGGRIEHVCPEDYDYKGVLEGLDLWINEEGMVNGMETNIALRPNLIKKDINYSGLLFGPIVVAKSDDEGRTIGLTDDEAEKVIEELKELALKTMAQLIKWPKKVA